MLRLQAVDALKIAQDVVERQGFLGSWRSPRCCGRRLPPRGSVRWLRSIL